MTGKMLANLGYATRAWDGAPAPLVVIGRNALKKDPTVAARLEAYVRAGGRAMICAQDPQWMAQALEWRVCPQVSRRVFPMGSPVTRGMDADDLRDWTGSSTLIEAYPKYVGNYLQGNEGDQPYAGWHWGNRGGVTSAAIEKPHRSGWRPLLECEFDLAYTPLMELDYGKGRLIVCTLDLEDHVASDPAARRMAGRLIDYAIHCPLSPLVSKVVYLGGASGAAWLDKIGVGYQRSAAMDADAGLLLIGPDAPRHSGAERLSGKRRQGVLLAALAGGRVARHDVEAGDGRFRRVAVRARLARNERPERVRSSLAHLPGRSRLGPERRRGYRGGRPDWPQNDRKRRGCLLSGGPGWLSRGREDLLPLHALEVDPRRGPASGQPRARVFRRTAGYSIPFDTWALNLDGAWQMKVTLKLRPAASDATAYPDPGVTPAAKELVAEVVPAESWTPVTLPQMLPFFKDNDGEAVFHKEIVIPTGEAGKDMILALGAIDDFDSTYFNGVEIGHTDIKTANWWLTPRNYVVPGRLVKTGKNVIAVRVFDRLQRRRFCGQRRPANVPEFPSRRRPDLEDTIAPIIAPISRWEIIPTAITGGRREGFRLAPHGRRPENGRRRHEENDADCAVTCGACVGGSAVPGTVHAKARRPGHDADEDG